MSQRNRLPNAPLGAGLIVVLTLGVLALSNYQRKADHAYQAARQEYEQSKRIVTAEEAAHSKYTGDKSYREEWRSERDLEAQRSMSDWSFWTMLATWFGVVLLGATLWETTRTSIAAASAAEAAMDSVDLARDTSQRELRAYVGILSGAIRLVNLTGGGRGIDVSVDFKNEGHTPAYDFTTWLKCPVVMEPDAVPFGPPTPVQERSGSSMLAPRTMAHTHWTFAVSDEDLAALQAGTKRIFSWGGADYIDAFGQERHFRLRCVDNLATGLRNPGDGVGLSPHKLGYEAN